MAALARMGLRGAGFAAAVTICERGEWGLCEGLPD